MRSFRVLAACCALGLSVAVGAQEPLAKQTFDDGDSSWTAVGTVAKVAVVKDAAQVKAGAGALRFDYEIKKGDPAILLMPVTQAPPAAVKGIRFWCKTDSPTWLAMMLQERGGGRYAAGFHSAGAAYQQVELPLSDFVLATDKNDPADPNNKLDIEEIENVAIIDVALMLAQDDTGAMLKMIGFKGGPRTLWLDEMEILGAVTPDPYVAASGETAIDGFGRPQISWLVTGWVKPSLVSGAPLNTRCLKLDYKQNIGEAAGMLRFIPKGKLTGSAKLLFSAAAAKPTTLLVGVEETSGGKYNATVTLDGNSATKSVALAWADFVAADDSKDDNSKLDIAQVKQIMIIDGAVMSGDGSANTLWIGPVRVTTAK